jgi:hypothetical protein
MTLNQMPTKTGRERVMGCRAIMLHPFNKLTMNKRHWITVLLLVSTYPISALSVFFSTRGVRPWIDQNFNYVVSLDYYVDRIADFICWMIISYLPLRFIEVKRLTLMKVAFTVNLIYSGIDILMFLINHNKPNEYVFIFSLIAPLIYLTILFYREKAKLKELFDRYKHKIESKEIYQ